jgi:hypothetical protein
MGGVIEMDEVWMNTRFFADPAVKKTMDMMHRNGYINEYLKLSVEMVIAEAQISAAEKLTKALESGLSQST